MKKWRGMLLPVFASLALVGCANTQDTGFTPVLQSKILTTDYRPVTQSFGLKLTAQRLFRFVREGMDEAESAAMSDAVLANRIQHAMEIGDGMDLYSNRAYAYLTGLMILGSPRLLKDSRIEKILNNPNRKPDDKVEEAFKATMDFAEDDPAMAPDDEYWRAIDAWKVDQDRIPLKGHNYTLVYRTDAPQGVKDAVLFFGREDRALVIGDIEPTDCFQTANVGLALPEMATVAWRTVADGKWHYANIKVREHGMMPNGNVAKRVLFTFGQAETRVSIEQPCHG